MPNPTAENQSSSEQTSQNSMTPAKKVLTSWPDWKRDTLLSIFGLTIHEPQNGQSSSKTTH